MSQGGHPMPTETFYNLPKAKQDRITNAAKSAILKSPIEKITISMIVRGAKIPRGSFYQYFDGVEDLLRHVYHIFIESFEKHTQNRIHDEHEPLFQFFKEAFDYDYVFFTTSDFHDVFNTLMRERKFVGLDVEFHQQKRLDFFNRMLDKLDTSKVEHLSRDEQLKLYMLYVQIKNQQMHRVMRKELSFDQAKKDFLFYITLLEKGVEHL